MLSLHFSAIVVILTLTFWLHALGETGSDWRCGKAWQVSFGVQMLAKVA
jgi:hypothetical protein